MQEISVKDLEQVVSGDKKTIVKFGADWCTECAILKVKIAGIEPPFGLGNAAALQLYP